MSKYKFAIINPNKTLVYEIQINFITVNRKY